MAGEKSRRHFPDGDDRSVPSHLGPEWPPTTRLYHRESEDLEVPPLVHGAAPLRDYKCALCTIASDLAGRGSNGHENGMGLPPPQAAHAEANALQMAVDDWEPEEIVRALSGAYGVKVTPAQVKRHKKEHIFSPRTYAAQRLREMPLEEYNDLAWRGVFDTLVQTVEKTRQALASGRLEPSLQEGLAAAKTLGELLSYSLQQPPDTEASGSRRREEEMRMFVSILESVVERNVKDSGERQSVYEAMREVLEEQEKAAAEEANESEGRELPRGR